MLGKPKTEDIVLEMAVKIAEGLKLEVIDVSFTKEGGTWYLRVFIDKPEGINHDDCQALSQRLSDELDEKDPIPQAYILEVSSPGIERPLKKPEDYVRFKGSLIRVTTFSPFEGQKEFIGILIGLFEDGIHINMKDKEMVLPLEKVASARLEADF